MRRPSIGYNNNYGQNSYQIEFDCGFRIITAYYIGTDEYITRVDAKIDDRQYSVGFHSKLPIIETGIKMDKTDLITPASGIENCVNVKSSKTEIIRALKELINDLETDNIQ